MTKYKKINFVFTRVSKIDNSYCAVLTTELLNSKQKGTAGIGFLNPCFQIKMGSKSQEYKELFEKIDQEEDGEVYLRYEEDGKVNIR